MPKTKPTDLQAAADGAATLAKRLVEWSLLTAERDIQSVLTASVAVSNLLNAASTAQLVARGADPKLAATLVRPATR